MTVLEAIEYMEDGWKLRHKSWGACETIKRCWHKTIGIPQVMLVKDGRNGELEMTLSGEDIDLFFHEVVKMGRGYPDMENIMNDLNQDQ